MSLCISHASRDPSSRKGQVKSNIYIDLCSMPQWLHAQSDCRKGVNWSAAIRFSANGSRPEHGPKSVIRCDGSHPVPLLFYYEARATSGRVWHRFWEGCFRCFADRLRQEPVLRVSANSVRPGVAGQRTSIVFAVVLLTAITKDQVSVTSHRTYLQPQVRHNVAQ